MKNFIIDNKRRLKNRHYLLKANQERHWFNAMPSRMDDFKRIYGDRFCLVLYRDGADDAYVLPYGAIAFLFTDRNLQPWRGSERWHGSIRGGFLELRGTKDTLNVKNYHNAFDLLSN